MRISDWNSDVCSSDLAHVVDFKTGRFVPDNAAAVPRPHLRQMAAYAAALRVIFPGHMVEASLLYTSGPKMISLPQDLLVAHSPCSEKVDLQIGRASCRERVCRSVKI